jgi:two-component sensor histidine kinase
VLVTPAGTVLLPREFILPLLLFVLVALGFAIVSASLRRAWEQAAAAERAKDLANALTDIRPIAVKVDAAELYLSAEQAIPLGLIVNELVTNSLKHAFPGDRAGTVRVVLSFHTHLALLVQDDGIGCPTPKEGVGSRLVQLLAQQLGAKIAWEHPEVGCLVRVELARADTRPPGVRAVGQEPRRQSQPS